MNFNLREPNPGDRISANLIREIVRAIRALTPIPGHGMKTSTGPNGTVYSASAPKHSRIEKSSDLGRYRIESIEVEVPDEGSDDPASASITFANTYFRVGGKTYEGADSASGVELPAIVPLKVSAGAVSVPTTEIASYPTLAALQADEADRNFYVFPLYSLDEYGSVECDFRTGPETSMGEY